MCFDDRAADNIISYRTRSTTVPSNYSNNAAAVYTYVNDAMHRFAYIYYIINDFFVSSGHSREYDVMACVMCARLSSH